MDALVVGEVPGLHIEEAQDNEAPGDRQGRALVLHEVVGGALEEGVGAHGEHLGARLALQNPVVDEATDVDAGEQRGHDAHGEGHGEALDGARAEDEEQQGREELGHVAVHDGPEHPVEARIDGPGHTLAQAQLLLDALKDEDVGVHGNAQGEHEARDARQGQGRPEGAQQAHHHDDVHREGDDRVGTGPVVEEHHEGDDRDEAHHGGTDAGVDGVAPQAGAHDALFQELHGGAEGAAA